MIQIPTSLLCPNFHCSIFDRVHCLYSYFLASFVLVRFLFPYSLLLSLLWIIYCFWPINCSLFLMFCFWNFLPQEQVSTSSLHLIWIFCYLLYSSINIFFWPFLFSHFWALLLPYLVSSHHHHCHHLYGHFTAVSALVLSIFSQAHHSWSLIIPCDVLPMSDYPI